MCGIVAYVGNKDICPLLLEGLKRLEYRGYDSAGVCVGTKAGFFVKRAAGRISVLEAAIDEKMHGDKALVGNIGMAHTRWATHGPPYRVQCPSAHGRPAPCGAGAQRHN